MARALELLEALCADEPEEPAGNEDEVRVSQLSRRLGLSKSVVFRLLVTFENRGYVERATESGVYRIGMNAYELGRKLLAQMGLLQHARPVMENLCRHLNEAVYLAIRRGSEFLFMDLVESAQQVKIASLVGKRFPLHCSAPGFVFLAFDDGAEPAGALDPEPLNGIRWQGFCHEQGGLGDMVSCLAAPFFDKLGKVAGALCVVGPSFRMQEIQINTSFWPFLKESSEEISSKLGYMQPYAGRIRL